MILVFDVGNTNIVFGLYAGDILKDTWRITTNAQQTSDEYGILLLQFFNANDYKLTDVEAVIISSVVPQIMYSLEHMSRKYLKREPMIIGAGIKTGMNIKYDNPKEVGADRIVNAVAGFAKYGGPLIIIDFGTATTFCVVNEKGEYLGGAICPGIRISMDALFQRTAKLPKVELQKPSTMICKNTINSIQAGVIYGYVGQVDYIVNKMKKELKSDHVKVIATGGLSTLIASESETIDVIDGLLTLEGLKLIYERNCVKES